jgi:hypothetical protein
MMNGTFCATYRTDKFPRNCVTHNVQNEPEGKKESGGRRDGIPPVKGVREGGGGVCVWGGG